MARIWQAGPRRAVRQAQGSDSSDEEEQSTQNATDSRADTAYSTHYTSTSSPLSSNPSSPDQDASPLEPAEADLISFNIADKNQQLHSAPPVPHTLDQLEKIWGHVHKPTDLANQAQWSRPLHWKEKMAYMFWKFASQDSINELLGSFAKKGLVRPRREVKMTMGRLLAFDCVYDSGEESEDGEEEGGGWSEVDLGEIVGEEESGVGAGESEMELAETQDGVSSIGEPDSLLAEGLSATQEMVDDYLEMMEVDTEKPSSRASSRSRDPEPPNPKEEPQKDVTSNNTTPKVDAMDLASILNPGESLEISAKEARPRESTSPTLDSKQQESTEKFREETTTKTSPKIDKPLSSNLANHPKRKLQADTPQSPRPAKRPRPTLDAQDKIDNQLNESWRDKKAHAPVAPEIKQTRIALRIVGQRGKKSVKYKIRWAEAGDCSFADSWVDRESGFVTGNIAEAWEVERSFKEKGKK